MQQHAVPLVGLRGDILEKEDRIGARAWGERRAECFGQQGEAAAPERACETSWGGGIEGGAEQAKAVGRPELPGFGLRKGGVEAGEIDSAAGKIWRGHASEVGADHGGVEGHEPGLLVIQVCNEV